ncbi:type II secretion system protein GspK [Bradyrhizobium sp. dw_411]|uniref:general secretion pathway protein GspK n=1 Tax=Bradyrhizobium sp. dw_411 TaxID=2720082 RepID=UPI001BCC2507|nr:type II secretion system protein GspK [Bradyrhizobium sp. dw_411]
MMPGRAEASSSERGFVIVAVLWILMALSALAAIFAVYLSASAQALALNDVALQTEALVSAGLELTTYQLTLADDKTRPSHGSFHFRLDDADVLVTFTSEAARIDLNFAPKEVLAGLFAGLGASRANAVEDADRIVGWRTRPAPGTANVEEALYAGLNYTPRQSLFTHVNELALVAGLPPVLVERALPFVTVFNGSPDVDATIAAPEVIAALPGKGGDKPGDTLGAPSALTNDPLATANTSAAQSDQPTAKSTCYRIEATIRFNNGRRAVSEVVIALGDKVEPYRVLSWQDDLEIRSSGARKRGGV